MSGIQYKIMYRTKNPENPKLHKKRSPADDSSEMTQTLGFSNKDLKERHKNASASNYEHA